MRRVTCGGCGGTDINVFLNLGQTPLADNFTTRDAEPERWYDLQLGVCVDCWLVQQMEVVNGDELFNADYTFYSSTSLPKVNYHQMLAKKLLERHGHRARQLTVEIASNDGDLLQHFKIAGCRTLGIDPAGGPAEVARSRGLETLVTPFSLRTAEQVRESHGPAGLILANHVVAHVADLDDFFAGVAHLLDPLGVAVIEVQYVADLLVGNQFDHVYHEHRFHLSLTSIENVCARHGLVVEDAELTEPQGGSLQVTVGRGTSRSEVANIRRAEEWLRDPSVYVGVQGRVDHIRYKLTELVDGELRAGRRVAGYAASAKSTTLLNFCGLGVNKISYIVDTTPHKIGRLSPGLRIPIVAPNDRPDPDTYVVLAWNYLPSVLRREADFIAKGGRLIVPIPTPVLI